MPMPTPSPPTMRDIADACGVSLQTVSLAVRGRPGVGDQRRREIQQTARQMGYYPVASARMLATHRSGQIGVVVARVPGAFAFSHWSGQLIESFVEACEQRDRRYHIDFHHHSEDDSTAGSWAPPHAVAGGLVDGVLLVGDVGQPLRDWLKQRQVPFVTINEPASYCVLADEGYGMRLAVEHLAGLGHRRIAAAFGPLRYAAHRDRREAFFAALADLDMSIPDDSFAAVIDPYQRDEGLAWANALLDRPDRPTAVIGQARAVHHAALSRGLTIPGDLSLIEWHDPHNADFYPAPTVIHVNFGEMMNQAMSLLEALLAGRQPERPHRRVPAELFPAASTARAGGDPSTPQPSF